MFYLSNNCSTIGLWATLNFGKASGQLPGVDLNFRLRLSVSPKHGCSWETTTIKTHVPKYKESLADHTLSHSIVFDSVLTRRHWDSLLDLI